MGLIPFVSPLQSSPVSKPLPTLHVHAPDHTHPARTAEGSCLPAQQLQTSYGLGRPAIFSAMQWTKLHLSQQGLNPTWGRAPSKLLFPWIPPLHPKGTIKSFLISYSHLFISLIILYIILCQFSPLCGF